MDRAPPASAMEAFARADWGLLMPRLLRAASACLRALGWCETDWYRPYMLEPRELVNHAIESCLSGQRRWVPGTGATPESLVAFLCEIMRSIAMNERMSAAMMRRAGADGIEEQRDDAPSPSRELAAKQQLLHVERALAGDPEALTVHRLVCEGFTTPAELAEALGWPVARVKAVRLRTSRRLKSMRVTLEGDGEQPASEDPR